MHDEQVTTYSILAKVAKIYKDDVLRGDIDRKVAWLMSCGGNDPTEFG